MPDFVAWRTWAHLEIVLKAAANRAQRSATHPFRKLQKPSSKLQRSSKFQRPSTPDLPRPRSPGRFERNAGVGSLGLWNFFGAWSLELGTWSFPLLVLSAFPVRTVSRCARRTSANPRLIFSNSRLASGMFAFYKRLSEMIAGFLLTAVVTYFVGSLPTGYLVAWAKGVDLRAHGSGNIGATNAFRVLGKGPGILVLLVDALKGAAAVIWVPLLFADRLTPNAAAYLPLVAGIGAILGHNYTCWLRFKGGKGVATTAGVMGALLPWALVIALSTWFIVLLLSRYMSIASIVAAVALPVGTVFTTDNRALWALATVLGGLAIWRHRGNIQRLRAGTEPRFEFRQRANQKTPS